MSKAWNYHRFAVFFAKYLAKALNLVADLDLISIATSCIAPLMQSTIFSLRMAAVDNASHELFRSQSSQKNWPERFDCRLISSPTRNDKKFEKRPSIITRFIPLTTFRPSNPVSCMSALGNHFFQSFIFRNL